MKRITNQDTFALLFPDDVVTTSAGQVQADLVTVLGEVSAATAAAAAAQVTAGNAATAAAAALATANAAQADATQALADSSIVWLLVQIPDATSPPSPGIYVPAPVTGTFSHITGIFAGNAPPSNVLSIGTSIGGEIVTGGSISIGAADTPVSSVATANNAVTAFSTFVWIELATSNITAGNMTIILGFTRDPTP